MLTATGLSPGGSGLLLGEVALQATSPNSSSQLVVTGTHTAGSKLRCHTPTTHTKNITGNLIQARSTLPDDGSQTIRNMSGVIFVF